MDPVHDGHLWCLYQRNINRHTTRLPTKLAMGKLPHRMLANLVGKHHNVGSTLGL
jgi:hypothetical protein